MSQAQMLETIGPSLVVTALTDQLPMTHVQWDQPHEGNLFEFLYRHRAIQRA